MFKIISVNALIIYSEDILEIYSDIKKQSSDMLKIMTTYQK